MFNDKPCGRALYDGGKCICHSDKQDKDIELFQQELDKIFADKEAELYDLRRFVFPVDGWRLPSEFNKSVFLYEARFCGEAGFSRARFSTDVTFLEARFSGTASFDGASFSGNADFYGAQFSGEAFFTFAEFSGKAGFDDAEFSDATFFDHLRFTGAADFHGAQFSGEADFTGAQFLGAADFHGTQFSRNAVFDAVLFRGKADFGDAKFLGVTDFNYAVFSSPADFEGARFSGLARFGGCSFGSTVNFRECHVLENGRLSFDREPERQLASLHMLYPWVPEEPKMFEHWADFSHMTVEKKDSPCFRKTHLAKCLFLETDVTKVSFTDVTWPTVPKFFKWFPRCAVCDEVWAAQKGKGDSPRPDYRAIARLNRQLQKNYAENLQYAQAGDFYIGEQEMERKAKGRLRQYLCASSLYKLVSYYGQSYLLPFFWLVLARLTFPLYFLYDGIKLYPNAEGLHVDEVNYAWSWRPWDCLFLTRDYWNTFFNHLSFITFDRSAINLYGFQPYQKAIIVLQTVLIIILITFFLLALRRAFKRKSF